LFYAEVCHVPLNMPFDTDLDSAFYAQANEVFEVGNSLTPEQQEIARFWFDPPNQTGLPAGHWVSIENQMVEQRDLNLEQTAGMYSLVGMALADSFISAWSLKYEVMLLRPETYIHEYIRDSWQPYIQTPPFPEYPSGHSVTSAAAAEVLTSLFGIVAFTDRTHVIYDHEPLVREFTSFEAAASEAAISRLYGGIHYRTAIENGMRQGRCVGQQVLENIQLGPIPQGE
jgi:membrane-associated phospholipid phosphatase